MAWCIGVNSRASIVGMAVIANIARDREEDQYSTPMFDCGDAPTGSLPRG